MNKIFSKLTLRNIKSNIKQFLSVILIVFLSTMLLCGFIVNSSTLEHTINRYFEENNLADLWLYVDKVTEEDKNFFVENQIEFDERFHLETTANVTSITNSNNAKIYVSDGKISTPEVNEVRRDSIDDPIGCYIDKHVAENYKIRTNGTNTLSFSYSVPVELFGDISELLKAIVDGNTIPLDFSFEITGTMQLNECADTYSSWPVFITEKTFLQGLNSSISKFVNDHYDNPYLSGIDMSLMNIKEIPYNQVLIKTDEIEITKELIQNHYDSGLTDSKLYYLLDRDSIESVVLLSSEISQSKKMIYVFPVIFLIVSVLVILTTINQLVLGEKQKIGTLKSIGVPDKKILRHYSSYGAWLCVIGSVLGIVLGTFIIPEVMFIKYKLVYSLPNSFIKLNVPYLILLAIFAGMILLGYLVSLIACYNILHKKPIECLRQDTKINVKSLSKRKIQVKKVPLGMRMAARNIRIKPVRTLMATIGIMGCVALLLCGFGIGDTIDNSVTNDLGGLFNYDITTTYSTNNFLNQIQDMDEIDFEKSEPYLRYYVESKNGTNIKSTYLYQIVENSELTKIKLSGDEVIISDSVARELKLKVGDSFTVQSNGVGVELKITKIIKTSFLNGIYVAKDMETSGFNTLVATRGIWLKCNNYTEKTVEYINTINGTDGAYSMQGMIEFVESRASSIDIMTNTLKFFAIMLAVVVLLNLIFLIMKERIREIATLKVLGQNLLTIASSVFYEILIMAIVGTFFGMFLGFPLLILVLSINKVEILNFIYHISPLSFVLSALIVIATIFFVSLFSLWKVRKINMIESLKSIE